MISAVDQNANTFTITGKSNRECSKSQNKTTTKNGTTASMRDVTENEEASGLYWKNAA